MKTPTNHPDRTALLAATHTPDADIARHLESCEHCRFLFALLQLPAIDPIGDDLFSPAIYSSAAIAAYERARHPASHLLGSVAFDSWKEQPEAATRAVEIAEERRLSFSAGDYTLELVAEKERQGWACTARLYCKNKPQHHFILEVGRRKLHAESRRCYFWRMKTPPRSLAISSGDVRIDFGDIPW